MTPVWALTAWTFYNALTEQKPWQWWLAGILAGLSILTKYQSALLLASMFIILLVTQQGRNSFKKFSLYGAGLLALVVVTPHLFWLYHNHFPTITYATARITSDRLSHPWLNHIYYPILFTLQQAGAVAPVLILFIPFYFCQRASNKLDSFHKQFLFWIALGPFVLTLLFSVFSGAYLEAKWATPYFFLAGVLLVAWYKPIVTLKYFKYFLVLVFAALLLTAGARAAYLQCGPAITKTARADAYFPGKSLAEFVTTAWHTRYHTPLKYVGGDHYIVANISAYSPDHPIPYFDSSTAHASWINEDDVRKQGAVFVWFAHSKADAKPSADLKSRFPALQSMPLQYFNKLTTAAVPPMAFGIAFLPPLSLTKSRK